MNRKELKVRLTTDRNKKPLAIVENLPGLDAEMNPEQLRSLAKALNDVANACEQQLHRGEASILW